MTYHPVVGKITFVPARVLVVDDAQEVSDLLVGTLGASGHETRVAGTGAAAEAAAREWLPDVVVLDLTLPDLDGFEVCRRLRTFSDAYVLMLSARGEEIDRVMGLTVGADDYMTKPFSPRELLARVDALMRRPRGRPDGAPAGEPLRRFGPLTLDPQAREVAVGGRPVETTKLEFDLLEVLTAHPRRVFSRDHLRELVWGGGWFGDDHAIDVHVSNVRRKLAAAGAADVVSTVRGVGYRLSPDLLAAGRTAQPAP